MKNIGKTFVGLILATYLISCTSQPTGKTPKLNNHMDTISYAIGLWVGMGPANVLDKGDLDLKLINQGIAAGFSESDTNFTMQDLQTMLRDFTMEQQKKQAEADEQEGIDFLKENKTKKGVVETESGLQYRVIKEGAGLSPVATDSVKVHYKGTLIDGKEFDSSYKRGEPTVFQLNRVIPGWTEGVQLMKEGAVYEFVIPSQLAYGPRGAGQNIKPNATLVFEIELIEVIKTNSAE